MTQRLVRLLRRKAMKGKCEVCGREYELCDLLCLLELMRAKELCVRNGHPLICKNCSESIREFFEVDAKG